MNGHRDPPALPPEMPTPTAQQRAVIAHPLEPLRVTAGAGTGKTTTMALRLAHLVTEHGVAPEEALGITFTNKASEELAARLRASLPELSSAGHEVQVITYHGFAYGLLREFGPLLGIPRELQVAPTGYVRQLIRDALGSAPRRHLDLTQPGRRVDELGRLSAALGDHLLEPRALLAADGGDEEVGARRAEMALVLEEFARRKASAGIVDYSDMVALAHRLVSDPEIASRVRERYRVVLLDEYQDTNPAQRELLRAIFGDGFPVTAVGDSDQTIYEWRGASAANFADFPVHFRATPGRPAASLDLSVNWRSTAGIIDVANTVRDLLSQPSDLDGLVPRPAAPPGKVRSHWLRTSVDEAEWIASEIERLHQAGRAWRDVAVLFRKHRQMALVRDALARRGIPTEVASLGGLLEVPEVADLHAWLRVLGEPDDDIALARLLLGSGYRLGLGDLAPISRWALRRRRDHEDTPVGWALLESLDDPASTEDLADEARRRLHRFSRLHRALLEAAQGSSLVELCRSILDRTGAWPEVEALGDAARLSARLNLYRFLDLAEDWSPLDGSPSLEAFLEYLDLLSEEGADEALDAANVSGEDAVLLTTVHGAKGLEWPVVFLPALCKGTFPSGIQSYDDPWARAEVLPQELRLDAGYMPDLGEDRDTRRQALRLRHDDQELRTAYVAVTRAMDELVASGAFWYTTGVPKEPSELFAAIDASAAPEPARVEDPGDPPESLVVDHTGGETPDPHFAQGWQDALAAAVIDPGLPERLADSAGLSAEFAAESAQLRLTLGNLPQPLEPPEAERFRTSVTGLVTFASCPRRFHWAHVDRLPRRPSLAARHGTELHRRIEQHLRGSVSFAEIDRGAFDPTDAPAPPETAFARYLSSRFAAADRLAVEAPFSLEVAGTRVDGRVDAVFEPEQGLWEVVDFKSGRAGDDPARRVQLEAYALAVAEAGLVGGRSPERVRVTFAYLGDDEVVEESEHVDAAWLARAREHLGELVASAAGGESAPTPSAACRWCDFSRFCEQGQEWLAENG